MHSNTELVRDGLSRLASEAPTSGPSITRAIEEGDRARRRRRGGLTGGVLLSCLGLAVVAVIGVRGSAPATHPAPRLGVASTAAPATPSTAELRQAVLDRFFPVSGEEVTADNADGLTAYRNEAVTVEADACLRSKGLAGLGSALASSVRIEDLPDLTALPATGLSGQAVASGGASSPAAAACVQSAEAMVPTFSLDSAAGAAWQSRVRAVDSDPSVVAAYQGFGTRARANGIPVDVESQFFAYVDGEEQHAATEAERQAEDRAATRAYVAAIAPVEMIRIRLRSDQRATMLAGTSAETSFDLGALQQDVSAVVQRIHALTGVRWPAPSAVSSGALVPVGQRVAVGTVAGPSLLGPGTVSSADHVGTVVVLNLWGTWCAPCRGDLGAVAAASRDVTGAVQFIGIDTRDVAATARNLLQQRASNYPEISDPAGSLASSLSVSSAADTVPRTVILDRQGRVAVTFVGTMTEAGLASAVLTVAGE